MPRTRPAMTAGPIELSRPARAQARAGTTYSVYPVALSPVTGAASTTMNPAMPDASIHETAASRSVFRPANAAVRGSSAAARRARPVRLYRNQAPVATATAVTIAASHSTSCGIVTPPMARLPDGRMGATMTVELPNRCTISACRASITPADATTLASAGADRSGRNTSTCTARPSSTPATTLISTAGTTGTCCARRTDG